MVVWVTCRLIAPGVRTGLGGTTACAVTTSPPVRDGWRLDAVAVGLRCAGAERVVDGVEPDWVVAVTPGDPTVVAPAELSAAVFDGLPARCLRYVNSAF